MKTHFALILIACASILIAASAIHSRTVEAQAPAALPEASEFEGKIVYINGLHLTDVKFLKLGERLMIVGTGVKTDSLLDKQNAGVRIGFAWDSVHFFKAMTPEQFEK